MRSEQVFLRRMLWRRGERPEPVVALLGPRGAGKSAALRELSRECGGTVVHAGLDFGSHALDPISAAAMVAFDMTRTWTNIRRDPTFHRFALGLLALNEELDSDHARARDQIADLIRSYVRNTVQGRRADRMRGVTDATVDVVARGALSHLGSGQAGTVVETVRDRAKPLIGSLLQSAARWGVRDALRWHSSIPEAESARTIDSLIRLSRTARDSATGYLMRALLADIRENAWRHKPMRSACDCLLPDAAGRATRHDHVWVLLVDNADSSAGRRFLSELAAARCGPAVPDGAGPAGHDPLLVVAACGEWRPGWTARWCEPWRAEALPGQRRIPRFSRATHELWARHSAGAVGPGGDSMACWYPVWLDPLDLERTQELVGQRESGTDATALGRFVHRLSAGHPGAMTAIQAQSTADPGVNIVGSSVPGSVLLALRDGERAPLWERAAGACLPSAVSRTARPWSMTPGPVAAAAYLADPRGERDARQPTGLPDLGRALEEMRKHLWISTFTTAASRIWPVARGGAAHPAMLHPWPARCLLAGLSEETVPDPEADAQGASDPRVPAWAWLFSRLRDELVPDPAAARADQSGQRPERLGRGLFYDLALDRFERVAASLSGRFDEEDHRAWIRLLDDVTSAPCELPVRVSTETAYERLLSRVPGQGCTVVEVTTAKLLALLWLYNDPLTLHTRRWDEEIHDGFTRLAHNSTRRDVSPLQEAAARFAP